MKDTKFIETSSVEKQMFRHLMSFYFNVDDADDVERIYRLTQHWMAYPELKEELKNELGDKYDMFMANYDRFTDVFIKCKELRALMKDEKDKGKHKLFKESLGEETLKLKPINTAIRIIFITMLRKLDLRNIAIPSPTIKSDKDNKYPFRTKEVKDNVLS